MYNFTRIHVLNNSNVCNVKNERVGFKRVGTTNLNTCNL